MGGNEVSDYTYTKFTIKVIVTSPVLSRCPRVRNRRKNPASVHQDAQPNGLKHHCCSGTSGRGPNWRF